VHALLSFLVRLLINFSHKQEHSHIKTPVVFLLVVRFFKHARAGCIAHSTIWNKKERIPRYRANEHKTSGKDSSFQRDD
jgi:hypothetical protein